MNEKDYYGATLMVKGEVIEVGVDTKHEIEWGGDGKFSDATLYDSDGNKVDLGCACGKEATFIMMGKGAEGFCGDCYRSIVRGESK